MELDAVELSILAWEKRLREVGPCSICGGEMGISSMGGGDATRYNCSSAEASPIEAGRRDREETGHSYGPHSKAASEHWRSSEVRISSHGDERVLTVVEELRRRRKEAGLVVDVPIGYRHYPYGHENGRCWKVQVHQGSDVWSEELDFDFDHDPSHREK